MSLNHVWQNNDTGCFIACVSMLTGQGYYQTLVMLKPKSNYLCHGFKTRSISKTVLRLLKRAGIKAHVSSAKKFNSFKKINNHALFIIRWKEEPDQCHTIVYDFESKKFLDPHFGDKLTARQLKTLERQLDTAIIVDKLPEVKAVQRLKD